MFIMFTGKGCRNCPFLVIDYDYAEPHDCTLAGRMVEEELLLLDPNLEEKPKDCPFAQYPNNLEIQADDS